MAAEPDYQPDTLYAVRFSRVVQFGAFRYFPRHAVLMQGSALNRIVEEHGADAVESAEPR